MEKLNKMRGQLHTDVKNLRNIEYMIQQESFESLWIVSDKNAQEIISKIIEKRDKMRLINWIRKHPSLELGEMSILQLKDKARDLRIKNYSRMKKHELLMIINAFDHDQIKNDLTIEEMILDIVEFTLQMDKLMTEAGIQEEYLAIPEQVTLVDIKYIEDGYEWISKIYNTVHRDAKAIKNLLSDEMWQRYSAWADFADHREMILLKDALTNLKRQIVNVERPTLFKKSRIKAMVDRAIKRKEK